MRSFWLVATLFICTSCASYAAGQSYRSTSLRVDATTLLSGPVCALAASSTNNDPEIALWGCPTMLMVATPLVTHGQYGTLNRAAASLGIRAGAIVTGIALAVPTRSVKRRATYFYGMFLAGIVLDHILLSHTTVPSDEQGIQRQPHLTTDGSAKMFSFGSSF